MERCFLLGAVWVSGWCCCPSLMPCEVCVCIWVRGRGLPTTCSVVALASSPMEIRFDKAKMTWVGRQEAFGRNDSNCLIAMSSCWKDLSLGRLGEMAPCHLVCVDWAVLSVRRSQDGLSLQAGSCGAALLLSASRGGTFWKRLKGKQSSVKAGRESMSEGLTRQESGEFWPWEGWNLAGGRPLTGAAEWGLTPLLL